MAPSAYKFDRGFVGLGARVTEEDLAAKAVAEALRQSSRRLGVKNIRDVGEFVGLILDGANDTRMTVTKAGNSETAEEIEIAVAIRIEEIRTLAAGKSDREASIDIHKMLVGEINYIGVGHFTFYCGAPH